MAWWHWVAMGLLLAGLELAGSGGFFVIFFGVAALVVGGLVLIDLAGPLWLQWLLFSVVAILSLALFRGPLHRRFQQSTPGPARAELVGEVALPLEAIGPGQVGRVELRGATWTARNTGEAEVRPNERCVVHRVEGLMVWIRPEGGPPWVQSSSS